MATEGIMALPQGMGMQGEQAQQEQLEKLESWISKNKSLQDISVGRLNVVKLLRRYREEIRGLEFTYNNLFHR